MVASSTRQLLIASRFSAELCAQKSRQYDGASASPAWGLGPMLTAFGCGE